MLEYFISFPFMYIISCTYYFLALLTIQLWCRLDQISLGTGAISWALVILVQTAQAILSSHMIVFGSYIMMFFRICS
jgi:hypothetical protein